MTPTQNKTATRCGTDIFGAWWNEMRDETAATTQKLTICHTEQRVSLQGKPLTFNSETLFSWVSFYFLGCQQYTSWRQSQVSEADIESSHRMFVFIQCFILKFSSTTYIWSVLLWACQPSEPLFESHSPVWKVLFKVRLSNNSLRL